MVIVDDKIDDDGQMHLVYRDVLMATAVCRSNTDGIV
jgi:hypothetical protein